MGKSLSQDIRERVVALVDDGLSCHEAARRLQISAASAVRIVQRKKRTGGVMSSPQGPPRRSMLDKVSYWLKARVEAEPDITMPELVEALEGAHDLGVTPAMLSRHMIHRLGFTYKNRCPRRNGCAPCATNGDIAGCRRCALRRTGWCLSTKQP